MLNTIKRKRIISNNFATYNAFIICFLGLCFVLCICFDYILNFNISNLILILPLLSILFYIMIYLTKKVFLLDEYIDKETIYNIILNTEFLIYLEKNKKLHNINSQTKLSIIKYNYYVKSFNKDKQQKIIKENKELDFYLKQYGVKIC